MPYKSISEQLPKLHSLPGIEAELDGWQRVRQQPGVLNDISDGNVWKDVLGPDNLLFFRDDPGGELHIGVTLGCDWYITHPTCNNLFDAIFSINDSTQVSMDPLMMSDGINDMSALIHNLSMMMSNGINDILGTYVHIH